MAHHYEPDKLIELVQLCCWKGRADITQNGLIELAAKLGAVPQSEEEVKQRKKEQELNDRYIVDLLSDARKALKAGTTVPKRESYVRLLLNYAGFNYWDDWKEALRKPGNFLFPEKADFEIAGEKALTIVVPQLLEKQLSPTLSFVRKSSSIDLLSCREETLADLAQHVLAQLDKSGMMLCALPLAWKDQVTKLRQPAWGDFSGTGRILPVWIDATNEWNPVAPFIPVKQEQSVAGIQGLLIGLLFLENYSNMQPGAEGKQQPRENAPHFNNSTIGFYMQGGTVHHLNTGGDQTINNYFD